MSEPERHPGDLAKTPARSPSAAPAMREASKADSKPHSERKLYDFQRRYEDYKGKMIRSMNRYCACGYPLWVQEIWDGSKWERVCYEGDHKRQPLSLCPSCHADLSRVELKASQPGPMP